MPVVSDSDDDPDHPLTPPGPAPAVLDQPTESTKHNEHNDTRPNEMVEEDRKSRNHPIITAFDQEQHVSIHVYSEHSSSILKET